MIKLLTGGFLLQENIKESKYFIYITFFFYFYTFYWVTTTQCKVFCSYFFDRFGIVTVWDTFTIPNHSAVALAVCLSLVPCWKWTSILVSSSQSNVASTIFHGADCLFRVMCNVRFVCLFLINAVLGQPVRQSPF